MRKAQIRTDSIVAAITDRLSTPDQLFAKSISTPHDTLDNSRPQNYYNSNLAKSKYQETLFFDEDMQDETFPDHP
jgi:hypothetical protein